MDVIVNGETETCTEAASVADLLQTRGHAPKTVVVEHNGNIVPADAFAATQLHGGRHGPMGEVEAVFPFSDIRTS